jgi:hypothetical protein
MEDGVELDDDQQDSYDLLLNLKDAGEGQLRKSVKIKL